MVDTSSRLSFSESEPTKDVEEAKKPTIHPIKPLELFKYSTKYEKLLLLLGVCGAIVAGLASTYLTIIFGDLVNSLVYQDKNLTSTSTRLNISEEELQELLGDEDFLDQIYYIGHILLVVGAVQIAAGYLLVTAFNYTAEKQIFRIRKAYLSCILQKDVTWFDLQPANEFASRLTVDMNKIHEGIGEKLGILFFLSSNCFFAVLVAFYYGWQLTLVAFSTFPLMTGSSALMAMAQTSLAAREADEYAKAGSIVEEVVSAIRTVLAFGGEDSEAERYTDNLKIARKSAVKRCVITAIGLGMMWLIFYATYSLTFWYGIKLVSETQYPVDPQDYNSKSLIIILFSIVFGAMSIGQTSPYIEAFSVARGSAATIYMIIDSGKNQRQQQQNGHKPNSLQGTIEFESVSFSYPARKDVQVVSEATFRVEAGKTVALVGSSGSGKSTCLQLLQKFYEPSSGKIMLDGQNIQNVDCGWLRENIGYVNQEPILFATTIEENIRYGTTATVTHADVVRVAKEASAHGFIDKFPQGYDTLVGDRGTQLSGGQKQRIAIARILLKNPKILLLDEATSALDTRNEALIQRTLNTARLGRTTIIVAHRLSTIQNADTIIVMKNGQVVESGTHNQLTNKNELYMRLIAAQMSTEHSSIDETEPAHQTQPPQAIERSSSYSNDHHKSVQKETAVDPMHFVRSISLRRSNVSFSHQITSKSIEIAEEDEQQDVPQVSMKELLMFSKSEWPYLLLGCIGAIIQGFVFPTYAIIFGSVIKAITTDNSVEAASSAVWYAVIFLLLGAVSAFSAMLQSFMFSYAGEMFTERVRSRTFRSILKQELAWFDDARHSTGAVCSKLSGDAAIVHGGTGSSIGVVLQVATTLIVGVGVALFFNFKLGLSLLPFVPMIFVAAKLENRIMGGQTVTEAKALEQAAKIALEAVTNIKTIKSLRKENHFVETFTEALTEPHQNSLRQSHLRGAILGISQSLPTLAYAVATYYGGYLIVYEDMPPEDMFKVGEAIVLGTYMVGQAMSFAPNFNKAKAAADRIFQIINRKPLIDSSDSGLTMESDSFENIQFNDVQFCYPTRPSIQVLRGLTLAIHKGETIALVGQSGCGKSTLVNLLQRYYNCSQGTIDINGVNVKSLNVSNVRRLFGLVSQEPVLFNRSIYDNIAYGIQSQRFSQAEVEVAAKQANIHDFIIRLPDGYQTLPGSKGTQLSGGQKQRIAIARALIRNPQVLLLDEATSALDAENEKIVQATLDEVQQNRTNLIIAHRLSTIRSADKIVVVDGGKIVEVGTYEQLVANKKSYYHLHHQRT